MSLLESPAPQPLLEAIQQIDARFSSAPLPIVHMTRDIGLVFDLEYRLKPLARQEFIYLANKALLWLQHPPKAALREAAPFVVLVRQAADATVYELDRGSLQRLRASKGDDFVSSSVTISHHTEQDFERMVGSFLGHLGLILTHLTEQELLQMGGVVFKDTAGRTVGAWPSRESA